MFGSTDIKSSEKSLGSPSDISIALYVQVFEKVPQFTVKENGVMSKFEAVFAATLKLVFLPKWLDLQ